MLIIHNSEHFQKVEEFARQNGLSEDLQKQLDYLATYGCTDNKGNIDEGRTRCMLYPDFAPHSFAFLIERRIGQNSYTPWFNGGLIYEGPNQPANGSAPSFTVSLQAKHGWSVHT